MDRDAAPRGTRPRPGPLGGNLLSAQPLRDELLVNLDRVPEAGALVVVTVPKAKNGSGFPARVFAILP